MSDPVYRRVGRGGAGNWYSKKDVEEAEKAQKAAADLEAQKSPTTTLTLTPTIITNPIAASTQYTRAGRGGAGNFHDGPAPSSSSDPAKCTGAGENAAVQQQEEQLEKIKAAVAAAAQKPRAGGMGGRGGVGNWSNSGSVVAQQKEREEQVKAQEVELKVLKDVDSGLAMPPPAYRRPDQ